MAERLPRSERLVFRSWREDDLPLAQALFGDRNVTRFTSARPLSDDEVRARLDRELTQQRTHGIAYWPIFDREGAFVGCAGLRPRSSDGGVPELGFHLVPSAWGRGLATAAALAVAAHAFEVLKARAVFAGHHPDNDASRRVLAKVGFLRTHDEPYEATGRDHPSYVLHPDALGVAAPDTLFHIALEADWRARNETHYVPSSFVDEGFIHLSTPAQLPATRERYFANRSDVVLLQIQAPPIARDLYWEPPAGRAPLDPTERLFPHLRAPLPLGVTLPHHNTLK